jgi:hypothetical protein
MDRISMGSPPREHDHADGVKIQPTDDGNVALKFVNGDREVLSATFTPNQTTLIVAGLLNAATGAFRDLGKDALTFPLPTIEHPIQSTRFGVGATKVEGRFVIFAEAGEAVVGLQIDRQEMRRIARSLKKASYHSGSRPDLIPSIHEVISGFITDLKDYGSAFSDRFKARFRRSLRQWWRTISGKSYRSFKTIYVSPEIIPPSYRPIGKCIYCGTKAYSEKAGIRQAPLGAEHIIPEGLDGNLELPESSCHDCEAATSALERDVLLRTLKALRLYLGDLLPMANHIALFEPRQSNSTGKSPKVRPAP